jgi:hypothetical protein
MTDITALIAQARVSVQAHADFLSSMRITHGKTDRLYQQIARLADALEATVKEMHARELHHFEEEQARAEAEAERDRYRAEAESARKTGERILADALGYRAAIEEALGVRLDHTLPTHRAWPRYQDDVDRILIRALNENGETDE